MKPAAAHDEYDLKDKGLHGFESSIGQAIYGNFLLTGSGKAVEIFELSLSPVVVKPRQYQHFYNIIKTQ